MLITGLKVQKVLCLALPDPSPKKTEEKPRWGQRPVVVSKPKSTSAIRTKAITYPKGSPYYKKQM